MERFSKADLSLLGDRRSQVRKPQASKASKAIPPLNQHLSTLQNSPRPEEQEQLQNGLIHRSVSDYSPFPEQGSNLCGSHFRPRQNKTTRRRGRIVSPKADYGEMFSGSEKANSINESVDQPDNTAVAAPAAQARPDSPPLSAIHNPAAVLDVTSIRKWRSDRLAAWLTEAGVKPSITEKFLTHNISGHDFLKFQSLELEALGNKSPSEQQDILRRIDRLRQSIQKHSSDELAYTVPTIRRLAVLPFADSINGFTGSLFDEFLAPYFRLAIKDRTVFTLGATFYTRRDETQIDFKIIKVDPPNYGLISTDTAILCEGEPLKRVAFSVIRRLSLNIPLDSLAGFAGSIFHDLLAPYFRQPEPRYFQPGRSFFTLDDIQGLLIEVCVSAVDPPDASAVSLDTVVEVRLQKTSTLEVEGNEPPKAQKVHPWESEPTSMSVAAILRSDSRNPSSLMLNTVLETSADVEDSLASNEPEMTESHMTEDAHLPDSAVSMFISYTISEDRSGDQSQVMSQRLAALGSRLQCHDFRLRGYTSNSARLASEHSELCPNCGC